MIGRLFLIGLMALFVWAGLQQPTSRLGFFMTSAGLGCYLVITFYPRAHLWFMRLLLVAGLVGVIYAGTTKTGSQIVSPLIAVAAVLMAFLLGTFRPNSLAYVWFAAAALLSAVIVIGIDFGELPVFCGRRRGLRSRSASCPEDVSAAASPEAFDSLLSLYIVIAAALLAGVLYWLWRAWRASSKPNP